MSFRRAGAFATALALALASEGNAQESALAAAREFAHRLGEAMEGGPVAMDRLWAPAARDSSVRMLDVRSFALFSWSEVRVELDESAVRPVALDGSATAREVVDLVVRVTGRAAWAPRAYGVATALWRPMLDEDRAENRVTRREAWRIERTPDGWRALERAPLSTVHVRDATVEASVFSGQEALLVTSTFSLVAEVDSLEAVRFFLDRRSDVYDFLVNDHSVAIVRGSQLGSLGLEGFSPENESSFRLPRALRRGDEILVKVRTRSPLVHLRAPHLVTTLPILGGAFRERAWYPVFGPEPLAGKSSSLALHVFWPKGEFTRAILAGPRTEERASGATGREEESAASRPGAARSIDFVLIENDASAEDALDVLRGARGTDPRGIMDDAIAWANGEDAWEPFGPRPEAGLDPHPRSRRALVSPFLALSLASSRDLSSELEEALPLDAAILDELADDAATDAEQGAAERTAE